MATVTQKFGRKVQSLRKKQKMTQEKLAELSKIDYSYLNMIEAGKKNPTLKRIASIARALKVKLNDLLDF